jgi:hypothetical protein
MTLAFVTNTWASDLPLAHRLAQQIQYHHPDAHHLVIGDGCSPDIPSAICVEQPQQKTVEHCDRYSYRQLTLALERLSDFDHLIQLDPDCWLNGPLRPPKRGEFFGRLFARNRNGQPTTVLHGCCWGMSRQLVERLVEADPFDLGDYLYPENQCRDGSCSEDTGFCVGVDRVRSRRLWQNWGEVCPNGQQPGAKVWHPVKGFVAPPAPCIGCLALG